MSAKEVVAANNYAAGIKAIVNATNLNTSQKIRALYAEDIPKAEIALLLDKRYQHVRNVLGMAVKSTETASPIVQMESL